MPLPVSVVAFDPRCQQTLSSAVIGSDGIGAAASPGKPGFIGRPPRLSSSFDDIKDAEAEDRRIGWAGPGRTVRARTGLPPGVAAANGVRVPRSVLRVGRDRRRRGAAVLRWGRRHGPGSGGPVEGLTPSVLVSSAGSPDEATRCPLAVSSTAPVASPDLPPFPERGKTSPASKGGLAHKAGGHRERNQRYTEQRNA